MVYFVKLSIYFSENKITQCLFGCSAVKVFRIGLTFSFRLVDNTVPMMRRHVKGVKLHGAGVTINDVVFGPSRNNNNAAVDDVVRNIA